MASIFANSYQAYEAPKPSWWKWAIVVTASLGAVLEIIDTSIVNVALKDMQGNLGATLSEIGWVITGYAIANVIIIPLSAWLGDYFGKKNYFVFSLIGFVLASVLCGFATSLPMLIASRVLQGLAGGGLLAKAQAIIYETFPREEQGMAQAVFGLGVIAGPAIGPTLGGYLTDTIGWRWIFFINVPIGILAVLSALIFLPTDRINHMMSRKIDVLGIMLLTIGLAAFQTLLEEGQQDDWFSSPFIVAMAIASVIGIVLFIWQEMTIHYPAVNLRVLRHRSLAAGSIYSMILGMGLYGALFAIPIFTQTILDFSAMQTGMLLLPGAIASGMTMMIVGFISKHVDPRVIIACGSVGLALTMIYLSHINIDTSAESLFWPLIWRGIFTVMLYLPLNLATYATIPKHDISAASGFFNLTRQIGGSIGIAILTTILSQRENLHRSHLVERVQLYNPAFQEHFNLFTQKFLSSGSPATVAHQQAYGLIDRMVDLQSSILSFGDMFWIVGMIMLLSVGLIAFLGKGGSAAPVDAH